MLAFTWRRNSVVLALALALGACSPAAGDPETLPTSNAETAVEATPTQEIASDVPILPEALKLKVVSNGTDISYRVVMPFEDAVKFYQEELLTLGWEQKSKKDSGFADNITILRFKADASLSVTIQTIAGSDELSIRISRLPK